MGRAVMPSDEEPLGLRVGQGLVEVNVSGARQDKILLFLPGQLGPTKVRFCRDCISGLLIFDTRTCAMLL